jgi:hypothetical protein
MSETRETKGGEREMETNENALFDQFLLEVFKGEQDANLETFQRAVKARLLEVATQQAAAFKPGDAVEIVKVSPKYLAGTNATVVRTSGKKVTVTLAETVGRFRAGVEITCHATCVKAA